MAASQKRDRSDESAGESLLELSSTQEDDCIHSAKQQCLPEKKESNETLIIIEDPHSLDAIPAESSTLSDQPHYLKTKQAFIEKRKKFLQYMRVARIKRNISTPESLRYGVKIVEDHLYHEEKMIINLRNSSLMNISYMLKVDNIIGAGKEELRNIMIDLIVQFFNEVTREYLI